ncbi:unnamed protein product [Aspergillus oryzae]|uniref:Unnamed protein product n=1 Tax=Aspergillus oryzae TaxID=5062 RepID=A0AAN4YAW2_ASPOZ|nr:unnamed protein product [Aspergillus oryzae]
MSQYRNGGFISLLTRNGLACLGKKGRLHYVHVNPDGRQESDGDADDDDDVEESLPDATGSNNSPSPSSMIWRKGQKPHSLPASTSTNTSHNHQGERLGQSHRDSRHYSISSFNAVADSNETSPQSASYYAQTSAYECLSQPTDQPSNAFPAERDHYRLGPLKGVPETFSDASYTSDLQEACLIRYFVEKLAHWTVLPAHKPQPSSPTYPSPQPQTNQDQPPQSAQTQKPTSKPSNSYHTNTKYPTQASRLEKWNSLKAFETHWNNHKPLSYKPIYHVPPEPEKGSYFPTIWLMNDSQVVAEQHMELARILLAVSNPGMQRLGAGAGALNRALEAELRAITRRVIGLGLGNRAGPPALVTSAVGISICGEYFDDPGEREALVSFLVDLEFEYAWPTSAIVAALRSAWAS